MVVVQGEQDGFHWRVPKWFDEESERMSDIELLHDVDKMETQLLNILQRNRKVRTTSGTELGSLCFLWPCVELQLSALA